MNKKGSIFNMSARHLEFETIDAGRKMYELVSELYPICRSITGDGVRQTLQIIQRHIPLELHEVPSGTKVFDWVIPREWNINAAYIKDPEGKKIVDFKKCNLHILNYSIPVKKKITLEKLRPHIYTIPEKPRWIPYRTSYYDEKWGFCMSHQQFMELKEGIYEVCIDSTLEDGSLTYGEYYIKGKTSDEILISCHICHPSLCNDNLSGISLCTFLAKAIEHSHPFFSYRFVYIPGTIGSITWLSCNENIIPMIKYGLVVACVGDSGKFHYKKSRGGDSELDRIAEYVLKHSGYSYKILDFSPYGYDERQYCSPGINLSVGCLMRTPHGEYSEYHTSADNLDLVKPKYLSGSLRFYISILRLLEANKVYKNTKSKCEPQLGRRGLYDAIGGTSDSDDKKMAMLWILNLSDGQHSLLDIAEKSKLNFDLIKETADILVEHRLLLESER